LLRNARTERMVPDASRKRVLRQRLFLRRQIRIVLYRTSRQRKRQRAYGLRGQGVVQVPQCKIGRQTRQIVNFRGLFFCAHCTIGHLIVLFFFSSQLSLLRRVTKTRICWFRVLFWTRRGSLKIAFGNFSLFSIFFF